MAQRSKGARSGLGEPIQSMLADFCAAHFKAPEREVIRAAVKFYIEHQLAADPEARKRYEEAQQARADSRTKEKG
jgi:hypothetical protein